MTHWLHSIGERGRLLAACAAGDLPAAARARLESAVADCPICRRELEAYRLAAAALRKLPRVSLTAEETARFLPEVNRRIDVGHARPALPARPGLREILWDHPRLSLASAFTAALLLVGLTIAQMHMWSVSPKTGLNGVEIISVDVDEDASVMVFQPPGSGLKIIWVFDDSSS